MPKNSHNKIRKLIYQKFPFLKKIKYNEQYSLLVGDVQSGKTATILANTKLNVLNGITTIIILRNSVNDEMQLQHRNISEETEWSTQIAYLEQEQKKIQKKIPGITPTKFLYVGDCKGTVGMKILTHRLETRGKVIVAIGNFHQIKRINAALHEDNRKTSKKLNIRLVIDEADFIGYKTCKNKEGEYGTALERELKNLQNFISHTLLVTATPFPCLLKEHGLKSNQIISLPVPNNYTGISQLKWRNADIRTTKRKETIWENKSIWDTLQIILTQKPIAKNIPRFVAITVDRTKKRHYEIVNNCFNFLKLTKNTIVLSYNGDGIVLKMTPDIDSKLAFLPKEKINNGYRFYEYNKNKQYHTLRKYTISIALQAILDLPFIANIKTIIMVSKALASRGISFVSTNRKLHIHDQLIPNIKSQDCCSRKQTLRLCGCFPNDNTPLTVWTTPEIKDDIIKEHQLHQFFLKKLDHISPKSVPTIMGQVAVQETQIPKAKLVAPKQIKIQWEKNPLYKREGTKGIFGGKELHTVKQQSRIVFPNTTFHLLTQYHKNVFLGKFHESLLSEFSDPQVDHRKTNNKIMKILNHRFRLRINKRSAGVYTKDHLYTFNKNPWFNTGSNYRAIIFGHPDISKKGKLPVTIWKQDYKLLTENCVIAWHDQEGNIWFDQNKKPVSKKKQHLGPLFLKTTE